MIGFPAVEPIVSHGNGVLAVAVPTVGSFTNSMHDRYLSSNILVETTPTFDIGRLDALQVPTTWKPISNAPQIEVSYELLSSICPYVGHICRALGLDVEPSSINS